MPLSEPQKKTAVKVSVGSVAMALIGLLYEYRDPIAAWLEGIGWLQ